MTAGFVTSRYSYRDTGRGVWALGNLTSNKCLDQDYSGGTMHTDILAYTCQSKSDLQNTYSNQLRSCDSC